MLASLLSLDLARPNNCRIPFLFAQATRGSCPLLCDVILEGGVGQGTDVENNSYLPPPPPPIAMTQDYQIITKFYDVIYHLIHFEFTDFRVYY